MERNFQTLTLDNETYALLTELARNAKISRAAYVRLLLTQQANPPMASPLVSAGGERMINKHGQWVKFSELNPAEQLATVVFEQAGITLDVGKPIRELKKAVTRKKTLKRNRQPG